MPEATRKPKPAATTKKKKSAARKEAPSKKKVLAEESPPKKTKVLGWRDLGLNPDLLAAVDKAGFEKPSDIQRELIPHALAGRDCLGQARTGTGKTAAFGLPILQMLKPGAGIQAIVLVPTRELAVQVNEHICSLGADLPLKTVCILGGRAIKQQIATLRRNPEIAIGTPGRVMDLMQRRELDLSKVTMAVLDEVDRMLDIGFRDDIRRILRGVQGPHQTVFVSATLDEEIQKLARSFMHDPVVVNVSRDMLTVEGVDQCFLSVHQEDKVATLIGFLKHEQCTLVIVFTNTKHKARRVAAALKRAGINAREIHGDLMQERREKVMKSFRSQNTQVLVATDVASRGLDVTDISHIVNYDIPVEAAAYVHRVGRTARMGKSGQACTFVTPDEGKLLTDVEMLINKELPQFLPPWLVKRERSAHEIEAVAVAKTKAEEAAKAPTARYTKAAHRDDVLDSLGVRPVRRTLASRFRSARKFRR